MIFSSLTIPRFSLLQIRMGLRSDPDLTLLLIKELKDKQKMFCTRYVGAQAQDFYANFFMVGSNIGCIFYSIGSAFSRDVPVQFGMSC
jgi:hypothetical protein